MKATWAACILAAAVASAAAADDSKAPQYGAEPEHGGRSIAAGVEEEHVGDIAAERRKQPWAAERLETGRIRRIDVAELGRRLTADLETCAWRRELGASRRHPRVERVHRRRECRTG